MGSRPRHREPVADSVRVPHLKGCEERQDQNQGKTDHESHPLLDRCCLMTLRFLFSSIRRSLAPPGTRVLIRDRSSVNALRSRSEKRWIASVWFMSWLGVF